MEHQEKMFAVSVGLQILLTTKYLPHILFKGKKVEEIKSQRSYFLILDRHTNCLL